MVLAFATTKTHTTWKGRDHRRQVTITVGWKCCKCAPLLSSGTNNQQDLPKKGGNIHLIFTRALQDPGRFLWRNLRWWLMIASYVRCCLTPSNDDPASFPDHTPNNIYTQFLESHHDEEQAAGTQWAGHQWAGLADRHFVLCEEEIRQCLGNPLASPRACADLQSS